MDFISNNIPVLANQLWDIYYSEMLTVRKTAYEVYGNSLY